MGVEGVGRRKWRALHILGTMGLVVTAVLADEATASRRMVIGSHDGFELAARFHDAGKRGGAVLLLHQCDREGQVTGLQGLARGLVKRGIHALEIDLRGYGASRNDDFDGKNWQEAQEHHQRDVEATYHALTSLPQVDRERIGIVGASCGGRLAVTLARFRRGIRAITFLSTGLGRSPSEYVNELRGLPMLCIASEDDPHGRTAESMRAAFETSEHPSSRLVMLKGSAHGAPLFDQEPRLEATIIDWLRDRLN